MLQKWKDIIANWINCYFNESDKREERVTLESLLNIISHLRENLSLDESKSSILEAHTVEEFVREKYPDFRFNNSSVEATTEDEIYIVASLLLYFVCVNSKDLDIKHAMCSQLSSEDQEIILKFSKCLMECTPVTYKDVLAAINESCSQDSSTFGPSSSHMVLETPPALRSLHGEVRRLQAALDAERFDRNYLQEELARINLRVEKLAKEKEQYKLEIVNLKAKISMCCGQEKDARAGDAEAEGTAKLLRQLEEMEERLVHTQGQLDDAQYERDAYKAKINELKQERDKWLAASQQEAARASQLCSELEDERRLAQSLRELVAELQQHHQLNRLDSSQLECDDPDASVHSLHHNMSVCSEACANVVEVQLGEERAKIVVLKQQIQSLQDQLNDLTLKNESLEKVISERENVIFDLKHRINEEIEQKNNMTIHYSDAMSRLNNEINELEQKLKDNNQQSRIVVESKLQEIQTLQEEKLSLLQSLTDETNKLENIIKNLKSELESGKTSRVKMRDDYENHIMKLNEKVLNRNNELVELQNDVFEKSDKIEALYLELRKEKQARDDLVAKHHNECEQMNEKLLESENTIKLKCDDIARLTERLNYNFEVIKELSREVDELKYTVSEQTESCRVLEETKITMLEEVQMKEKKLEELHKHMENMENIHSEEKDKLEKDLDEAAATVNALQMQLHGELQFKIGLQEDYAQLEHTKTSLSKEVEMLREEINKLQNVIQHKDETIEGMNLFLQEEKLINEKVKQESQNLNEKVRKLSEDVVVKNNETKKIENKLAEARKTLEEELRVKNDTIETVNKKLLDVIEEKRALEIKLEHMAKEKDTISNELKMNIQTHQKDVCEKSDKIEALHLELQKEHQARDELVAKHHDECEEMNEKLQESENTIKLKCNEIGKLTDRLNYNLEFIKELGREVDELKFAVSEHSENCSVLESTKLTMLDELQTKDKKLEELLEQLETMKNVYNEENEKLKKELYEAVATINDLQMQLHGERQFKIGLQDDYAQLEHIKTSLSKEVEIFREDLNKLQNEIEHKDKTIKKMDLFLQEEKLINVKCEEKCHNLNEEISKLSEDIVVKNNGIKVVENELAEARKTLEEQLRAKEKEKDTISNELSQKAKDILKLQEEINDMNEIIENNKKSSEALHLELRKEKLARDEIAAKHHNECEEINEKLIESENTIKIQCDEIERLTERLEVINELGHEVEELKSAVSEKSENCRVLEGIKIQNDKKLEELHTYLETMENEHTKEKDKLKKDLDEAVATVNALQIQLHGELQFKIGLQNDNAQLEHIKTSLSKEVEIQREELIKLQNEIQHKDQTIEGMDMYFQEKQVINEKVEKEYQNLIEKVRLLSEDVVVKNNEIKEVRNKLAEARKTFEKELRVKHDDIESVNQKLLYVIEEKGALEIKLNNIIKERDNLSNQLSEKVNEILKLQEKIDEIIENYKKSSEVLHLELSNEKQARGELVAQYHIEREEMNKKLLESEDTIKLKCDEIAKLTERLNKNIEESKELGREVDELKYAVSEQCENCRALEETRKTMLDELKMKDKRLEELHKHMATIDNVYSEEKDKLKKVIDEAAATVKSLQMQVHGEREFKMNLQHDYAELEHTKTLLSNEVEILREDVNKLQNKIQHKDRTIAEIDMFFQEEKLINDKVKKECQNLNENIRTLSEDLVAKNNEMKAIKNELAKSRKTFEEGLRVKHDDIESVNQKLLCVIEEKGALEIKLNHTVKERDKISNDLTEKVDEILKLQEQNINMNEIIDHNKKSIQDLHLQLREEKQARDELIVKHYDECEKMKEKLLESENTITVKCDEIVKLTENLNCNINFIKELSHEVDTVKNALYKQNENCKVLEETKMTMLEELQMKDKHLEESHKQLKTIENVHSKEKDEIKKKIDEAAVTVNTLQMQLQGERELKMSLQDDYGQLEHTKTLLSKEFEILKEEVIKLQNEIQHKDKTIEGMDLFLQEEKLINSKVKQECQNLIEKISKLSEDVVVKNNELQTIKNELAEARKTFEDELLVKNDNIDSVNQKLLNAIKEKEALEIELNYTIKERDTISNELSEKVDEVLKLQEEKNITNKTIIEHNKRSNEIEALKKELSSKESQVKILELQNKELNDTVKKYVEDAENMKKDTDELKIKLDSQQTEWANKFDIVTKEKDYQVELNKQLKQDLQEEHEKHIEIQQKVDDLTNQLKELNTANDNLIQEKMYYVNTAKELKTELDTVSDSLRKEIIKLQDENTKLKTIIEQNKTVITELEETIKLEREQSNELRLGTDNEKLNLNNKCSLLQEYQMKAERQMDEQQKDITMLNEEIKTLKLIAKINEKDLKEKCAIIQEKEEQINNINKHLAEIISDKENKQAELESKITEVMELKHKMNSAVHEDVQKALRSEEWVKAIGQRDTFAVAVSEKTGSHKNSCHNEKEYREFHHQVDNTTSDLTHSSMDSIKTISDLEKIIHDKNRTITSLQSDITYLKSLIADSENKLLDVTKELEVNTENCQQLSSQLKKIVHQKNEEIAELKKQVNKMSVTENRASQIIKVSAKYQAIILKRIAEIKSNTVLKELTNFGNSANSDSELRRSLNVGTVTMEDLENFLETTDKHLKRCSEKQLALQKERDRLTEVNRINESEIINLKKFLTELSVSFKTFSTVKELYAQKFSRVVSVQRTVRREILSLDGHITDATMCKLERGYAAVMQDLSECVMNMERWVERCIGRTISPEKIKQAFTYDEDRASFVSMTFQNTGLEVQLEELENSFQKLLEEVVRAQKGEGARDAQSVTVMEVRAEYEDKLNRMKTKMKQLYQEQISVYKEKQRSEVLALEQELAKTREKLAESSKAYEEHIRALTAELWSVGEKFLTKKDEVEWLRKKQRSGSLMSLQHVHSSGLVPPPEEPSRPSDTHSLRSLPVHNNMNKRDKEGRGLHMSDEEGEVFDNRWLQELASTPRAPAAPPRDPRRLSELRWRNSLCPPHLKSSYPAETQFQPVLDEEDIKFSLGNTSSLGVRAQRKEVGITAYKKPGPPTPSKNAGRLSATDSELRESLRVEAEPQPSRKTSTPSRLRSLFARSNKNDTAEGTPRSRRLSIFRKK